MTAYFETDPLLREEVEIPPRVFLADLQVELGRRMVGIKTLAHNFSRRRKAEAQGKDLFSKHGGPPEGGLPKLTEVGQFHIKRRITNYR